MQPLVGLIMGSASDWETLQHAAQMLERLAIPHEVRVVSAHRTPDLLFEYAAAAEMRGIEVIIVGAGGAAHLPGMAAAKTVLPVLGVPVQSQALNGLDSLLSMVQMLADVIEEAVLKEFEVIRGMNGVRRPGQPKADPDLATVAVLAPIPVTP